MISMIMKVSLAAFMLVGGIIKVFRVPFQVEHWRHYQYPLWFLTVTGILEIAGALAMTAGIWNRYAAFGAGVLFVVLMAGAVHAHGSSASIVSHDDTRNDLFDCFDHDHD